MRRQTWGAVVVGLLVVAGCGRDDDGDARGDSTPDTASPAQLQLAADEHLVERGDTLWRIAEEACGDPWAYIDIFNQNVGRIQDDGEALVEPDLIEVGWILVIDCPEPDEREFREAPADEEVTTPPSTVPEEDATVTTMGGGSDPETTLDTGGPPTTAPPPAEIPLADVPVNELVVGDAPDPPGERPASDVVRTSCTGTSSLPMLMTPKAVLRPGETAEMIILHHGQIMGITVEDVEEPISVQLIDDRGSTRELESRPGGFFDLFVEPGLPSGEYVVEATSPTSEPAYMRVEIRPPENPDLLRQSNDDPIEFLLIGATGVGADVYRSQVDGCTLSWEYWQEVDELDVNGDGNGRLLVQVGPSEIGEYCLAFDDSDDIKGQCDFGRQRFSIE